MFVPAILFRMVPRTVQQRVGGGLGGRGGSEDGALVRLEDLEPIEVAGVTYASPDAADSAEHGRGQFGYQPLPGLGFHRRRAWCSAFGTEAAQLTRPLSRSGPVVSAALRSRFAGRGDSFRGVGIDSLRYHAFGASNGECARL